jgi:hypothetical protein
VTITGVDEADNLRGDVSWVSPIARALIKAAVGDEVQLMTPGGLETLEVLDVRYPEPQARALGLDPRDPEHRRRALQRAHHSARCSRSRTLSSSFSSAVSAPARCPCRCA